MKSVTLEEIKAWHSGSQKQLLLTFEDGTTIGNAHIVSESMTYEQTLCDSQQLEFGSVSAASFSVKILSSASANTLQGKRFTASLSAGTYTRVLGRFVVYSDEKSSDRLFRTLECYDELQGILNEDFSEWHNDLDLTHVSNIKRYRDAFFAHLAELGYAVTQVEQTLPNDEVEIITYDASTGLPVANFVADGYSGQDVLFSICQLNGCFGIINSDGKFEYIYPSELDQESTATIRSGYWTDLDDDSVKEVELTTEAEQEILTESGEILTIDGSAGSASEIVAYPYVQGSFDYEEYYTERITLLSIRQTENDLGGQYGEEGATYSIVGNPLLFNKSTEELNSIAQTLFPYISRVTYMPLGYKTPACLWVELGDGIAVNSSYGYAQSILLERRVSGITALMEEYSAQGVRSRSDQANNQQKSILAINQKTNELVRDVDQTMSKLTNLETRVNGDITEQISTLTQTAEGLSSKVSQVEKTAYAFSATYTNNLDGTTTINAYVYSAGEDITQTYSPSLFEWTKRTESGDVDIGTGYSKTVTNDTFEYGGVVVVRFTLLLEKEPTVTQGQLVTSQGSLIIGYNS